MAKIQLDNSILHYGSIITLSLSSDTNILLNSDGFSSENFYLSPFHNRSLNLITRARFIV
jgi:hypothetical protein